jgi:hypothetical protein
LCVNETWSGTDPEFFSSGGVIIYYKCLQKYINIIK